MTHEYLRAVEGYHLPYAELKRMTRQSVEHSFLPGQSLWASTKESFRPVAACASGLSGKSSRTCSKFLAANERAREQMKLEAAFAEFEKKF
jgi:adenosine deaminase